MMSRARKHLTKVLLVQLAVAMFICTPLTATPQTNDRVVLNVTVTTEKGDAIGDLTRDNFSVSIEKRPQNILLFNGEVPASIGILLDTSGSLDRDGKESVARLKENLKVGLNRFFQLGHPDNEYFVMTFDKDTELLQDWSRDPAPVTNKVDSFEFEDQTALYDAITEAIPKVMTGKNARRILIIVSDGDDSYSRNRKKDVYETLKRSDVLLYTVGILNAEDRGMGGGYYRPGADALTEFARISGGRPFFSVHYAKTPAFTEAFESLAQELRSQYQLVISAEESVGKEKWHKLKVTATRNDSSAKPPKLIARTRQGYYR